MPTASFRQPTARQITALRAVSSGQISTHRPRPAPARGGVVTTTTPPEDANLRELVGPVAYGEWQTAKPVYHADLAAWARRLPTLSDADFIGEAASAIHGSALTNSWRGNWNHEHFKATAAYVEAKRRHIAAGHSEDCRGRTLYSVAYNNVARGQGYRWPLDAACDGSCKDDAQTEPPKEAQP